MHVPCHRCSASPRGDGAVTLSVTSRNGMQTDRSRARDIVWPWPGLVAKLLRDLRRDPIHASINQAIELDSEVRRHHGHEDSERYRNQIALIHVDVIYEVGAFVPVGQARA